MAGPSDSKVQNILPVQALFNIDNSFNTFIGQGQPFVVSATESIGIADVTTLDATLYPTLSPISSGQVTSLDVTSTKLSFNPLTGTLSAVYFQGALNGTASATTSIANGVAGNIPYQTAPGITSFISNGSTGQVLQSNGSGAPTWVTPTSYATVTDDTTTASTRYPLFANQTTGNLTTEYTSSTKLQYVPSTGTLTATVFSGSGAGLTSIPNAALTYSSITIGSTTFNLGDTSTTLAGLTSVTSTTFVGALSGNASTATTATNATNIAVTDNTSSSSTFYPVISSATTGNVGATTSSTKLTFIPSTGTLTATAIDNTVIGGVTPAAGTFTTLASNGTTILTNGSSVLSVDDGGGSASTFRVIGPTASLGRTRLYSGNQLRISVGSTNPINFHTAASSTPSSDGNLQLQVSNTASAVNYVQVTGSATNNNVEISSQGSDSSVSINYTAKNAGGHNFRQAGGTNFRVAYSVTSPVNYPSASGDVSGNVARLFAAGSDTNIALAIQSKGTGAIDLAAGSSGVNISNGGTVTAITRTNTGTGYTTNPTWSATVPTTAGGVQSTGTTTIGFVGAATTINNGGTGYTAGDVLTVSGGTFTTAAQITVSTVSGGVITGISISNAGAYTVAPASPVSVTGGTGTGATFAHTGLGVITLAIGNAGSGYVEQPTVTFSGGGGSGAAAYASVGSGSVLKFLSTSANNIQTPSGNVLQFQDGGSATPNPLVIKNGGTPQIFPSTNNTDLYISSAGTGALRFYTNTVAQTQMLVSHTASAVNYVQVTGAATTATPTISAQGSDTNINFAFTSKGSSGFQFYSQNGGARQFEILNTTSAVNRPTVTGSVSGSAVVFGAGGTDTNIDLALTPKGTGVVQFGTYTAGIVAQTGYITIKDSGGTTRRLLVG